MILPFDKQMKRYGLLTISIGMVFFWLIGSYYLQGKPIALLRLPLPEWILGMLAILGFVLFLAIQIWILLSTRNALGSESGTQSVETRASPINLHYGLELFWTFLPIVITLLLAWSSWSFWQVR